MKIEADIDELVKLVGNATEAYTTAFFLADNRMQALKLWHFYSLSDSIVADASIPFGVGPIGWVAENLKPFDISKFSDRDSALLRLYSRNEDVKSFFAVPVMREGVLEGVLCIDSKKAYVFANKDQKLLTSFAKQFADLVNNVRVKRFTDTETSDVAFLRGFCREITSAGNVRSVLELTLNSAMGQVECDSCFLSLRMDGEDTKFRIELAHSYRNVTGMTFSDQDGLAGCVLRSKEPSLLTNRREDFGSHVFADLRSVGSVRSFLGVPLLNKGDVLGLICFIDSKENAFNQRDLQVMSIIADNASLAIAKAKAQERERGLSTIIDGLTGLYNFSGFQERLEIAFQEASPRRRPLSLIIMDLDDFGKLNNALGYKVGNEVLRIFAHLLLELVKDSNMSAARYGADEFALILPSIPKEQVLLITEKIYRAIEYPTFIAPNHEVYIPVSSGVSSLSQDIESCNDLVGNALHALSLAKSQGGNRVIRYDTRNAGVRI